MDLNTNLMDDKFLFPEGKNNQDTLVVVKALNERGIKTVKDFVDYDPIGFNNNTSNRHFLKALQQILRYKYLGEELVNDAVFELTYPTNYDGAKKLAKDLRRLGYGYKFKDLVYIAEVFSKQKKESHMTIEQFIKANYNDEITKTISGPYKGTILKHWMSGSYRLLPVRVQQGEQKEYKIRAIWMSNIDIEKFYIDYIEEKRIKDLQEQKNPSKETLEGLKSQLQNLVMMRDNLDKLIQDTQCQINELNGGRQTHGRK